MKKSRLRDRLVNTVNAGSMADIAFLLLIFFLVTTTIMQDKGIMVRLPPWTPDDVATEISARNVFKILVNADDKILAREKEIKLEQLKEEIKTFISNPSQQGNLASNPKKAVVSLQNDRSTSYTSYIAVYNEIKRAYNELRNELAMTRHGHGFQNCNKEQQRKLRKDIPLVISEAEPTDYKP